MQWAAVAVAVALLGACVWAKMEMDAAAQWEAKAKYEAREREKLKSA